MKANYLFCFFTIAAIGHAAEPIGLHPKNSHYFLFREKPAVLVTSTEHYGAVLNLDFDFIAYRNELKSHGLNLTRTFAGVYREVPGNFNIKGNTLAPAAGRFLCPWARSEQPGYAGGGGKFDLKRWDAQYFQRLKQFIGEAGKRALLSSWCSSARSTKTFDFLEMRPDKSVVAGGLPDRASAPVLAHSGREYAIYVRGDGLRELKLRLPAGNYRAERLNPRSGEFEEQSEMKVTGEVVRLKPPRYEQDIALAIRRIADGQR